MAKLVHLSEAASLAIHAMVLIAQSKNHINVNKLAVRMEASRNHLAKVLQQLVKYEFLRSVRGPNGGFLLNKDAATINLLDIYEAIEGSIDVAECPLGKQICPFNKCLMGGLIRNVTSQCKDYFASQTLDIFINDPDSDSENVT